MSRLTWLQHKRVANTGLFLLTGIAMAMWVVNIPTIQERTHISHSTLGMLFLLMGAGSVLGMQVAGWISDRWGSRFTATVSIAVISVMIIVPGLATSAWHLAVVLPVLGMGTGAITVAANDQAVRIQNAYGRPIMASFHGFFSVGGALGSGLGALLHHYSVNVTTALLLASLLAATIGAFSAPGLLLKGETSEDPVTSHANEPGHLSTATTAQSRRSLATQIVALAILAMTLNLAEGTASDWSAVHAVRHLGVDEALASLAYGTFAVAMTIGRFTVDRVVARVGPVTVVRTGSVLAATAMLGVILSPTYAVTLACWLVFGLGLSGVVPQIFTAAGNLSSAQRGVILSRVVGLGYLGMLGGPAVVGWTADLVGINLALINPFLCAVLGIVLARAVATEPRNVAAAPHPATAGQSA